MTTQAMRPPSRNGRGPDKECVRQAAAGRWREILTALCSVDPGILDGRHHGCPKCGQGKDRFRAFDDFDESGGLLCNQCHSKDNADGFASVAWLLGCKFNEAIQKVADHVGVAGSNGSAAKKDKPAPDADLEFQPWSDLAKHFLAAKPGITEDALQAAGARIARYKRQYTVIALPIVGQDLDPSKPVGWVLANYIGGTLPKWNKKGEVVGQTKVKITYGSKPGLLGVHGIERLASSDLPEIIWKTEGVTDLLALQSAIPEHLRQRHVVVTNSNGAGETPRWQAAILARCNCGVLHDADQPGQEGAASWSQQIAAQQGEDLTTRNVQLPFEVTADHGKDLRDWLAEGHTYDDLLALLEQTPPVAVPKTEAGALDYSQLSFPMQEKILRKLQIDVLYETEEGHIRGYSSLLRKSFTIRQVDRLKHEGLIQICGAPAQIHISSEPDGEDSWSVTDVRKAIALVASGRRERDDERGIGIWQGLDDEGHEAGSVVLAGSTEAAVWDGQQLRQELAPRVEGLVLEFGGDARNWYDFERLAADLKAAQAVAWRQDALDALVQLFERWRWRDQETAPTLVAGLVLATWAQTLFAWRPLVAITGESNSGKSYLFEALGGSDSRPGLFGSLVFKQAKSTPAGIRQGIGRSARIVLCDEFEASRDRHAVLELLRTSTRGEAIARGTAHGKTVQLFALRHISWVAAIEAGLDDQANNNRFIQLELLRAKAGEQGRLVLPSAAELVDLGRRLLAVAVWSAIQAKALAIQLKGAASRIEGIEPRHVESYAVPAAMLGVAYGYSDGQTESLLVDLLKNVDREAQAASDQEQLLDAILSSTIQLPTKGAISVAALLESPGLSLGNASLLESAGIKLVGDKLHIAQEAVKRHLLKGTPWADKSLGPILKRLDGAEGGRQRFGGRSVHVVTVPWVES